MRKKRAISLLLMLVFALACMGALAEGTTNPTEYTVTIHYNGHGNPLKAGSTTDYKYSTTQTVPHGAKAQEPPHDQEAGWEFQGWYSDAEFATLYGFNAVLTGNIDLYAKWKQLQYTVTFNANCTDTVTDMPAQIDNVAHGSTVTKPAVFTNPTREGYDFKGWYLETTGINEFNLDTDTVTKNITLYAKWERKQYTVTFKPENGVQDFTQTVNHGDKATKPADPVKQGYRFDGWYNGATKYEFTEDVISPVNLTAKWTKVYKVVFNMNGHGNTIKPVSVAADEMISSVSGIGTDGPKPTAEGYVFGGWYYGGDTNPFDFGKKPEEMNLGSDVSTIDLYAKWTARVTVKFEVGTSVTHEYDNTHPDKVEVQLYKDGVALPDSSAEKYRVQLHSGGSAVWENLPPDSVYTVREVSVPANFTEVCTRKGVNNYVITNVPNEKYAVTVTNTHEVDKIDIMVSKLWDDNNNKHRPEQIQVKVSKVVDGTETQLQVLELNKTNNWTATLKDQFRREAGQIIQYKIEEVDNPLGYKATCDVVVDEAGNYSVRIVNVLTGKLDIQGTKVWNDESDRDGIRPESVQLKIYENAIDDRNLVAIVIVDATDKQNDNTWTWTVQDLPVYDEFDRAITYIVVEDPVPEGYTASGPQYFTVNSNNNSTNN